MLNLLSVCRFPRLTNILGVGAVPRCYASRLSPRANFQSLDAKWQKRWQEEIRQVGQAASKKSYVLPMFAYPSGSLHMGHLRVYTISDVLARYRRMKGYNVLHPTGWDAFGLPAENAAIERGIDPAIWTEDNIAKMKQQLKSMNTSFDWSAELSTCSSSFYKHTQKLFLMLFNQGLAYQADALVNYDPVDKTVLANEQVDSNGRSWRSGALVEQINLRQWFFKITAFRESLLEDLNFLSQERRWPERVISQQRNWLGRSQGARIRFAVNGSQSEEEAIHVFTTRPDTLFGVKYLALSLSHPIVQHLASSSSELRDFLNRKATFAPDSKAGFKLPIRAISPVSGNQDTKESFPIFTAPYVLDDYGEGAVMGVPGHDSRDLAFWKEHSPKDNVPIVISAPGNIPDTLQPLTINIFQAFTNHGVLTALCGKYEGMPSKDAGAQIVHDLAVNGLAETLETWKLRDWLVSRQRYWGTPIPIIHCKACGTVPVPDADLPVKLPKLDSSIQSQRGNPLSSIADWVNCKCPRCQQPAKRETDTMDTFVDSSWYFTRFPDSQNDYELFSSKSAENMLPVDTYIGGVEHAILHLLYARFIYKFLCSEGLISGFQADREPFQQLIAQGMVHGKTMTDPDTGRFLLPQEIEETSEGPIIKATGKLPSITWEKMSKSKYNGVDPSTCISKFGADATRAHILFAAPVSEVLQWDEEKIIGIQRWFGRIIRLVNDLPDWSEEVNNILTTRDVSQQVTQLSPSDSAALLLTQTTISNVSKTFERDIYSLNTTISDLIKMTNGLYDTGIPNLSPMVAHLTVITLLRMIAPITPAFAEEGWEALKPIETKYKSVFDLGWPTDILTPEAQATLLSARRTMTCAVQINGKLRFTTTIPVADGDNMRPDERQTQILETILATEEGKSWLTQKNDWEKRKKVVVVGNGKLLNVVF